MEQEEKKIEISEEQVEALRAEAKEKAKNAPHRWKQKGGWVKCITCDTPHAMRVDSRARLVGEANGLPVFRKGK